MPAVKFVNEKKTVEVPTGSNLRQEARKNGVELYSGVHKVANCRGFGMCGSCAVKVVKGEECLSKPTLFERMQKYINPLVFLEWMTHKNKLRLACQTKVVQQGDVEVETHPSVNWHGEKFWG